MMPPPFDPADRMIAYHAALNAFDLDRVESMFAENAVYVSPGFGVTLDGRPQIMASFRAYFRNHPDQVAEDDLVERIDDFSSRSAWRLTATNLATGAKVARNGEEVMHFDRLGQICRIEVSEDPK
jgi:ketosteroid isomerase-like protein